jgi:phage baseplate assembly protein W
MPYQVVTAADVIRTSNISTLGISLGGATNDTVIFDSTYTSIEQEFAKLKTLLLTRKGERIMAPTFGTDLLKIIFQPNTEFIKQDIVKYIQEPVEYWLPEINLIDIQVTTAEDDPTLIHDVIVLITFSAEYDNDGEKTLSLGVNQNGTLTITP